MLPASSGFIPKGKAIGFRGDNWTNPGHPVL